MQDEPALIDLRSVITAFYRVLLMREPENAGLDAHMRDVQNGVTTIEKTLSAFFKSDEFQQLVPRMLDTHASSAQARFTNDHSQFGELGILLRHWVNNASSHRIVVDVGARGRDRSNSFDLLKVFGWRGLLIEANPALIEKILEEFSGLDCQVLNFAISDYDGEGVLHLGINDDVSSLNADASRAWGEIQGTAPVHIKRLVPILQSHHIPPDFDLLSLDIEGEDMKVFNDVISNSEYRPHWVIIEASFNYATRSLNDLELVDTIKSSYKIAGQTPANLILERNF